MNTWFIADTHFNHTNIIKYENRPFDNCCDMLTVIRDNWNMAVGRDDIVYVLGDFDFRPSELLIRSLNGKKLLVRGNHDNKSNNWYRSKGFCEVYDRPIIIEDFYILSHEPVYINESMPYANIHGHIHSRKMTGGKYFNCGVELNEYCPVSFDFIKRSMSEEACHVQDE